MMGNSLASVQSQERRWLRFTRRCAVTGKVVPVSPDLSFYCDFITYHFHNRKSRSVYDRKGLGDYFELQSRYMLPRHVWPRIGYVDWVGLSRDEMDSKMQTCKEGACGERTMCFHDFNSSFRGTEEEISISTGPEG